MCLKTLLAYEHEHSKIFKNEKQVPFHKNKLPCFDYASKYTALAIIFCNRKFYLARKDNGFLAIPGGGSEPPMKNYLMFKDALDNVKPSELFRSGIIESIDKNLSYPPAINALRETLEELGFLGACPTYFGHQKTKNWRDEIVFLIKTIFDFDQEGNAVEVTDSTDLSIREFSPIGKSVNEDNPLVSLTIEELINSLSEVVFSHQIILAHFLLSLIETEEIVGFRRADIEACINPQ